MGEPNEESPLPEPLAMLKEGLEHTIGEWSEWLAKHPTLASYARQLFEEGVWVNVMRFEGDAWFEIDLAPVVEEALDRAIHRKWEK